MCKKTYKMIQKLPLPTSITTLTRSDPVAVQESMVTAIIMALGSNHHAEEYLPLVREKIATLGKLECSAAFQNPDFTATREQPKPDYTNQCVYLELDSAIRFQQLQLLFKSFENECHRARELTATLPSSSENEQSQLPLHKTILPTHTWRQVTMDIDILLIKVKDDSASTDSQQNHDRWIIMADRYPFKAHENAGITAVILNKRLL